MLPQSLEDYVSDTNPVPVVDVFVDEPGLVNLGCEGSIGAILAGLLTTPRSC